MNIILAYALILVVKGQPVVLEGYASREACEQARVEATVETQKRQAEAARNTPPGGYTVEYGITVTGVCVRR